MEQQDVKPMDENQLLRQLVSAAQSHPVGGADRNDNRSARKRIALNKLVVEIYRSPSLKKPVNKFNIPNYQDIYDEALNTTCTEICQKINTYDPEYPVMAWVNKIFNYRIQDVATKHQKRGVTNVPRDRRPTWWEIDRPIASHQSESSSRDRQTELPNSLNVDEDKISLKTFIEADPEGRFSERHIQNLPNATFKNICLLQLDGRTWSEIAEYFGTSIPTISGFYRTSFRLLQEYLQQSLVI
jgi:DNA-directed RNA polymerase specialized sigma24 family protein